MIGSLHVLNVSRGHLEIKFDGSDPDAVETARKAITDMLERNYLIVAKDEAGEEHKVEGFDPETNCYIVKEIGEPPAKAKKTKKLPMTETAATAVAPVAGG